MESFRLLHLSDLHMAVQQKVIGFPDRRHLPQYPLGQFSLSPSSYDFDLAKAVAKHAFVRGNQLDAILITGDLATLAIIAADFTLQRDADADVATGGRWAYMGQGKVYPAVLQALIQETQAQRAQYEPLAVVWALHFPPEWTGMDPVLRLGDDHLLAAAGKAGVHHLFSGHSHEPRHYALASNPAVQVYCAGTATQYCAPPPNANSLHPLEIDVVGGTIAAVRWATLLWNAARKDFI